MMIQMAVTVGKGTKMIYLSKASALLADADKYDGMRLMSLA